MPGVKETENQGTGEGPKWIPVAEDHSRQSQESLTGSHTFIEAPCCADAQVGTGQPSDGTAGQHAYIPDAEDVDAQCVCCFWMLAYRAYPQPPAGVIH